VNRNKRINQIKASILYEVLEFMSEVTPYTVGVDFQEEATFVFDFIEAKEELVLMLQTKQMRYEQ
jgi:hypothetical protein